MRYNNRAKMSAWIATGVVLTLMTMEFESHPFDLVHVHSEAQVDDVVSVSSVIAASANVHAVTATFSVHTEQLMGVSSSSVIKAD